MPTKPVTIPADEAQYLAEQCGYLVFMFDALEKLCALDAEHHVPRETIDTVSRHFATVASEKLDRMAIALGGSPIGRCDERDPVVKRETEKLRHRAGTNPN